MHDSCWLTGLRLTLNRLAAKGLKLFFDPLVVLFSVLVNLSMGSFICRSVGGFLSSLWAG